MLCLLLLLTSCEALRSTWHSHDRRLARIGYDVLYESEVATLLPADTPPEDSVQMVRQYIDTWALSRLLMIKAREELSKSDRDISDQLEEMRRDILGFRYEKRFVEENLDTVVSIKELQDYYAARTEICTFPYSVVKARIAHVSVVSPYYETIKSGFRLNNPTSNAELAALCKDAAEKYSEFSGEWIPSSELSSEIGISVGDCERDIAGSNFMEYVTDDKSVLVYIYDRVPPGEVSPFDYNKERLQEIVISKRKKELIGRLERELLDEAVGNRKLKIYNYDE